MPVVMAIELAKVIMVLLMNDYKEVDFECYMTQVSFVSEGETNYHGMHSKNGGIFYGAIHTYIHLFYYRYLTSYGTYYTPVLVVAGGAYLTWVYWMVKIAQLAFAETPKKANIVLLHCFTFLNLNLTLPHLFNDGYVGMFCLLAVLQFQLNRQLLGVLFLSLGLGVKLSAALYFPAVYLIVSKSRGIVIGTICVVMIVALQLVYAYPFVITYPNEYLSNTFAFDK